MSTPSAEAYVPGEAQRIEIYKRIAVISSQEEREELIDDLIDRFGEPGEEVLNLIEIAWLRALANALGADYVRFHQGALELRLHPDLAIDPAALYQAILSLSSPQVSLASGKRPALLIKTKAQDEADALYESRRLLSQLAALLPKEGAAQAKQHG